jgi:tryptophan-rich sensory protein
MFKKIVTALAFILLCLFAGLIGSAATFLSITTWYANINKPSFSPPNWIFGPVWTTLYVLMGIAAYLVYEKGTQIEKENSKKIKKTEIAAALNIFAFQLALNVLWSLVFFGFHSPLGALVVIMLLWLLIFVSILRFYPINKYAAYLMIPYMLWVSFASILNLFIFLLN